MVPVSLLAAVDTDGDGVLVRADDPLHVVLLKGRAEVGE